MKKKQLFFCLIGLIGIICVMFFLNRTENGKMPNITLVDQNGKDYHFGKDHTKLKLIEFIYTHCPSICPTTTQKMYLLQKDFEKAGVYGKEIKYITITIDPFRDSIEVLNNYMNGFHLKNDGNWIFLSGKKEEVTTLQKKIRKAANALRFQYQDSGNGYFSHTASVYLLDKNNILIKKFPMGKDFNKKEIYHYIMSELK